MVTFPKTVFLGEEIVKKNLLGMVLSVSMIILLSSLSGPGSFQMEKKTQEEDEGMWLALNAEARK